MSVERQLGPYIKADHVKRYEFAAKKLFRKRVLDAACGGGYGSQILHMYECNVTGVDIHQPAIDNAKEKYPGPKYVCGNILDKPWDGQFDAVVSFETLEHLQEPEKALRLFREYPLLICSVPNEEQYPFKVEHFDGDEYPHIRHYTPDEFEHLLSSAGFKIFRRYTQLEVDVELGTFGRFLIYWCV